MPDHPPVRVALIGCGDVAAQYLTELTRHPAVVEVTTCADLDLDRARVRAAEFGIPRAVTPVEALWDADVDLCVNLTPPLAHAGVSLGTLRAGKHVYSEKPLATTLGDGVTLLAEAERRCLRVGCAPDSFLAPPVQQARRALADGRTGRPVAAFASFAARSAEACRGPVFDMGPYSLTALITLLGPVEWVSAQGAPTHVSGTVAFASGVLATVLFSCDVHRTHLPRIEVYGTTGSLRLPDPNRYDGAVELAVSDGEWRELPAIVDLQIRRGSGVVELAIALREGRPHRASGALALHVLDVMEGLLASAEAGGGRVAMTTSQPLEHAA